MNALTIQMFVLRIHTATTLKAATPVHVMWDIKPALETVRVNCYFVTAKVQICYHVCKIQYINNITQLDTE